MNTKKLIDYDCRKTVFTGPSTVVVSLAFATTNIGSLGFPKHTVFIKLDQNQGPHTDQNQGIHIDPLH